MNHTMSSFCRMSFIVIVISYIGFSTRYLLSLLQIASWLFIFRISSTFIYRSRSLSMFHRHWSDKDIHIFCSWVQNFVLQKIQIRTLRFESGLFSLFEGCWLLYVNHIFKVHEIWWLPERIYVNLSQGLLEYDFLDLQLWYRVFLKRIVQVIQATNIISSILSANNVIVNYRRIGN